MDGINMAQQSVSLKRNTRKGYNKSGSRIDMTPMVDLGFLLITFFIFTSTMSTPAAMDLAMPKDGDPTPSAASGAFTILVGNNGAVAYYEGQPEAGRGNIHQASLKVLRDALIKKKKEVVAAYTPDAVCEANAKAGKTTMENCHQQKLMVLIKPGAEADYKTVIALLDEMTINQIARYALVKPEETELRFIP